MAEAEEAELIATRLHSEPRGTLRLSVPVAFGVLHIAPALADFSIPCPELRIDMTFNDRTVDLAEEGYDACVIIATEPDPKLVGRKLAPIRRKVCGTPEYFERHGTPRTPQDLRGHNCLVYSYLSMQNEWCFQGPEGDIRVPIAGSLRANNENALRRAVLGGLGIALLPTFIVGGYLVMLITILIVPPEFPAPMNPNILAGPQSAGEGRHSGHGARHGQSAAMDRGDYFSHRTAGRLRRPGLYFLIF